MHLSETPPQLPPEIFYNIADRLYDDVTSLRNLALVSRGLVKPAQSQLFDRISIGARSQERFGRLIHANQSLGGFVSHLVITGLHVTEDTSLPLAYLPNLRAITLRLLVFSTTEDIFRLCGAAPSLCSLTCYNVEARARPSTPNNIVKDLPPLQSLVVKHGGLDQATFVQRALDTNMLAHLRSLDLSFGATDQHLYWVPIIRTARHSLRHLSISMSDAEIPANVPVSGTFCTCPFVLGW